MMLLGPTVVPTPVSTPEDSGIGSEEMLFTLLLISAVVARSALVRTTAYVNGALPARWRLEAPLVTISSIWGDSYGKSRIRIQLSRVPAGLCS